MAAADVIAPRHPYYPEGILLSGNDYIANDWNVASLILAFAAGWTLILAVTLLIVRKVNPNLKGSDQGLVLWFVLSECGLSVNQ
jgi:cholestenol delta-isomerase